jgi:hypothetical protein
MSPFSGFFDYTLGTEKGVGCDAGFDLKNSRRSRLTERLLGLYWVLAGPADP